MGISSWRDNYGTHLMLLGVIAATFACIMAYLDWLPRSYLSAAQGIDNGNRPANSTFIARIELSEQVQESLEKAVGQANEPAGQELPSGGLNFYEGSVDGKALNASILSSSFNINEFGDATLVERIPPGRYSVMAYIDMNRNGSLDVDADQRALEPSVFAEFEVKETEEDPDPKIFDAQSGQVEFGLFQID